MSMSDAADYLIGRMDEKKQNEESNKQKLKEEEEKKIQQAQEEAVQRNKEMENQGRPKS